MKKTKTKPAEDDSLFTPPPGQPIAAEAPNNGALAVRETERAENLPARVVLETNPVVVMEMIERVASNPNVNPDNLGKLLSLQERILDRQAKLAFNEAFVRMAPHLPMITKDGRIVVKEKNQTTGRRDGDTIQDTPYAKWETISPAILPTLSSYGFSIRHRTETAPDGKIRITAIFYGHGHQEESYMDFELDTTGSKNNAQARVSVTTYGRRITACAAINLVAKGEDDDGNASGKSAVVGEPITPEQLERLIDFGGAVQCPEQRLIKHLNETRPRNHPELEKLADLPASRFEQTIIDLQSYEANKKAREEETAAKAASKPAAKGASA